jgi:GGDEF domain-containing protein
VIAEKHRIAEYELNATLSIGNSVFPGDGEDADTLLKNADAALYHVKGNGRNNFQFFTPELNGWSVDWPSLEHGLR